MGKTRVIFTQEMLDADFQINAGMGRLLVDMQDQFRHIRGPLHPDTEAAFNTLCWAVKGLSDVTGQHLQETDYQIERGA